MANVYWTNGAGTGVGTTAANWSTGLVPAAGEDIIFTGSRSNADMTAGLTVAANVHAVHVRKDYTGQAGNGTADPMIVTVTNGASPFVRMEGGGSSALFIRGAMTELFVDADSDADPCVYAGGAAHTIATARFIRGNAQMGPSTTVTNAHISFRTDMAGDVKLTFDSGSVCTNAFQTGGLVLSSTVAATLLEMDAGVWRQANPASGTHTSIVIRGGVFEWNVGLQTITLLTLDGTGVFDASGLTDTATITDFIWKSNLARAMLRTGKAITFTNAWQVDCTSPRFEIDAGATLTPA